MEEGKTTMEGKTMEEGKTTTVEEGKTVEVEKTVKTEEGKAMEEGKTVKTEEGKTAEEGKAVKTEEGKAVEEEGKTVKTEEGKTADEGKTMKAVQYEAYGGGADALKHVEVPVPTPEKDDILIKVEAVGINPIDWRLQNGLLRPLSPSKFPYIPLCDIAGEVVEVGSEVKNFKPGDKVVAMLPLSTGGGLAEYAVAKENLTVSRPAGVSAADGAGLPTAGLTAHQAVAGPAGIKLDGSEPKKNILITAASGGVGCYAVQLAKLGNAHVTATCGARNIDLVKSLGADEVLDYKTPEGAALKSPSGLKYDAVIHCAKDISWSTCSPNLSTHGKVIEITPVLKTMWTVAVRKLTFSKKQMVPLLLSAKGENLDYLVGLVKDGKLKTVIDSKYPLDKAEEAWAKSAEGHAAGKVIVEI